MGTFWKDHGTKLLGFLVAAIGAMGDCLELFKSFDSDPKHIAAYTLIVGLGSAIIRRGFTNSAAAPAIAGAFTLGMTALLAGAAAMTLLSACTTLSFDEQLATGYATYTTVEKAADAAYVGGTLPKAQAQRVRDLAKDAHPFLDAAQAAEAAGDGPGATQQLQLAVTALTALQTYVNQQAAASQGKK